MATAHAADRHVLVVEDNDQFRRMVARMLEAAGFRVTAAADFTAAIGVIEGADRVDLLLADLRMPAGTPNGITIGRMTRMRRRTLPIIYMTGAYDPTTLSTIVPDAPVLTKPFSAPELIRAVNGALVSA